jgi:hypothetical protein
MKRGWFLVLLPALALPLTGCKAHVDADDDDHDKTTVKVDTKGDHKGVTVDKD